MNTPTLDIIIVNWNTGRALQKCLISIAQCQRKSFKLAQVIVVDNASTDGSANLLAERGLPLVLLKNDRNLGFAAACNQGARHSHTDYLLFLNPDTVLFPDSLQIAIDFLEMQENTLYGICGGCALHENGQPAISAARFPTLKTYVGKTTGLSFLFPTLFPPHMLGQKDCRNSRCVDQVIGAFFFLRRTLFEKLGGFDERFFLYFEEVDFSFRAKLNGSYSFLLPDLQYIHTGWVSSRQVKARRLYYFLKSRFLYTRKHYGQREAAMVLLLTWTLELASRIITALIKGSLSIVGEIIQAYALLFSDLIRPAK